MRKAIEEEYIPDTSTYIGRISSVVFHRKYLNKKMVYEWLNKTDAPEQVWKAYLTEFNYAVVSC
jgi:hypothetical protein